MQALLVTMVTLAIAVSADNVVEKLFLLEGLHQVTHYQKVTSARSELQCVIKCTQRPGCESCAYGSATRDCFLHVTSQTGGNSRVFRSTPLCSRSDAVDYSVINVTWRGSSQVGDLSCNDDDFIYTVDSPTVSCQHPGVWVKNGTCARRIYRNTTYWKKCWLPRSPEPGWSMCVKGTACAACDRFNFNLKEPTENPPVQDTYFAMDVRFNFSGIQNVINVNSAKGNDWLSGERLSTFPFALGQPFKVELRLISQDLLQVFVDNILLTNFTNFAPGVKFTYFISREPFDFVDVWAGCD